MKTQTIVNYYSVLATSNMPTTFAEVSPWAKVEVTVELLAECGIAMHTPSVALPQEAIDFLEKFYDLILADADEEEVKYLPSWVLVHPTHGALAFLRPNLGKRVTRKTHTFKEDMSEEATKHLADHLLPKGNTTWKRGKDYERKSK